MLYATRNGRAPIAVAPAVGWVRFGPKSGSAAGSRPMRSRRPSNCPLRRVGRLSRSGRVAARAYRYTGIASSRPTRSASARARATQSSMVTSRTGTNGTTSVAPMRGCSPACRVRSIRSVATRTAASAASTLASGGATNVNTERLWAASAWTSSSLTPGTLESALRRASMVAALRPSEKFGTHSTRGDGIDTSNAERGTRNAEQQGGLWLLRSYVRSAFPLPRSAFSWSVQELHEPAVHLRIAGHHRPVLQHIGRAVERGHHAARLADEHNAGGHVPRSERQLPETIEAADGHVDEIERRRACPPDAARRPHNGGELIGVASQQREILEGEPGPDEGLPRLGQPRDVEPAVALPGAESARAPIHSISRHIVHDAGDQRSFHQHPDRNRVLRIAVQKIRRAVERIHNPHY